MLGLLFLLGLVAASSAAFTHNCMKCICQVEGCESVVGQCNEDSGSLSCGPYQIKEPYYIDCGSPGAGWQPCTMYMDCSETCVQAYMARYGTWCTEGRTPICEDYAKIHNGGPTGCRLSLPDYWAKVKACCDSTPGGCD